MAARVPRVRQHGDAGKIMSGIDIAFCRILLLQAHKLVKQHFPDFDLRTAAWVYKTGRQTWEFHGPLDEEKNKTYYWHGRAANAYEARYNGWMAWLRDKKLTGDEQ